MTEIANGKAITFQPSLSDSIGVFRPKGKEISKGERRQYHERSKLLKGIYRVNGEFYLIL